MTRTFQETLNASVVVTSVTAGTSAQADGGNVKELELEMEPWGFCGSVRLWVVAEEGADEFYALLTSTDLLELELSLAKALYKVSEAPAPLRVKGLVLGRKLREVVATDRKASPVLYREYSIAFVDSPRALLGQHHPSAIYAKKSLEDVIKENTPSVAAVTLEWPALKERRAAVCLGLGGDRASFYDLLFWLCDRDYGHAWYDYSKQALVLRGAKPETDTISSLPPGVLATSADVRVELAEPPRASVKIRNSYGGAKTEALVTQPHAVDGVRRDYLVHTSINAQVDARKELEDSRCAAGSFDVRLDCASYPELYLAPGAVIKVGEEFGDASFVAGQSLRIMSIRIQASAVNQKPEYDIESSTTAYEMAFTVGLEAVEDRRWRGPSYTVPHYPLRVEGKIVSSLGSTGDRTYSVYQTADSKDCYRIDFPLWNSTLEIPFSPDFLPAHLYFPAIKDSRVIVAVEFDSARIERFLDWGTDVTVPYASQGNQVLLGRDQASETSIKHWYVDNIPKLVIARSNAGDVETLTVTEGTMTLELTEEGGGGGFTKTVSVEPEAELSKAQAQQKSDLAVADLEDAADGAAVELGTSAEEAASTVRQQARQLNTQVEEKTTKIEKSLEDVSDGLKGRTQEAADLISSTRQELDDLLK